MVCEHSCPPVRKDPEQYWGHLKPVYIAVLALLSCLGAWGAWRQHPLYTARSTLRIGAELLLLMGCAVCVLIEGRSQTVQIAAVLVMVVLLSVGMILGIMMLTTPASAPVHALLPTQSLVTSQRQALLPWAKSAAVFFAVCGLLALAPGPLRYIVGAAALIGAMLSCVMFPVGYVAARQRDLTVTAVLQDPWLHWQYAAEPWVNWSATLVARLQAAPATFLFRRDGRRLAGLGAVLLLGACFIGYGSLLERIGWAVGWLGLLIAVIELAAWDAKLVPGAYGGPSLLHVRQYVLVPAGAPPADLALLQSALARRCPSARIELG
jgi:hypothetical protein